MIRSVCVRVTCASFCVALVQFCGGLCLLVSYSTLANSAHPPHTRGTRCAALTSLTSGSSSSPEAQQQLEAQALFAAARATPGREPLRDLDAADARRRRAAAADAQPRRDMSFVKYASALAAVACTTYLGILVGRQHRRPAIHHHGGHDAPHHGPPRPPRPSKRAVGDDDLDAAAAERHHIHAEPHSPELIQWGDWSAGGRFTKPPAKPYDSSYPQLTNLWEIVQKWNPDNVSIPVPFRETLAVLNYSDPHERSLAEAYRNAEVPFKIYDVPDVEYARDAWTDVYLTEQFDRKGNQFKVEESENNHFMYWRSPSASGRRAYPDWAPPTDIVHSTFADWLAFARGADDRELGPEAQHRYLMMGTPPLSALLRGSSVRRSHFVTKDLPCFTPGTENFFVTDIRKNKGIQCRFGMRGVIAEAHYDGACPCPFVSTSWRSRRVEGASAATPPPRPSNAESLEACPGRHRRDAVALSVVRNTRYPQVAAIWSRCSEAPSATS